MNYLGIIPIEWGETSVSVKKALHWGKKILWNISVHPKQKCTLKRMSKCLTREENWGDVKSQLYHPWRGRMLAESSDGVILFTVVQDSFLVLPQVSWEGLALGSVPIIVDLHNYLVFAKIVLGLRPGLCFQHNLSPGMRILPGMGRMPSCQHQKILSSFFQCTLNNSVEYLKIQRKQWNDWIVF